MNKKILHSILRQFIPNVGTLLLGALLLFAYRAWAAPEMPPEISVEPLLGPVVQGTTPGTLSYQGYLEDASGQPVDGSINMTFRLYNVPTGGAALWTEEHAGVNAVPVSEGLFNVHLGSISNIPANIWDNTVLYLGIQVGGDAEMSPREVVGAVPAAMTVQKLRADNIPVFTTSSTEGYWQVPTCDDTPYVVPGLSFNVPVDAASKLLIDFSGLGMSSAANSAIYSRIYVDGMPITYASGLPTLGGCRNSSTDEIGDPWCSMVNSAVQSLSSGVHTIDVRVTCDTSATAYVVGGWLKAILLPQ